VPSYDLHTHSTASDGAYEPAELVRHAAAAGIEVLALTDHDSTAGLDQADLAADEVGIRLIRGVEISVTWEKKTLHLIGLNLDPNCPALQDGLLGLQQLRDARAREMGARLERAGIPGVFEAASILANGGMVTRTHFAIHLARLGLAADVRDVFNRYITPGKPGYVSTQWADMTQAIGWIQGAGGVAVLAHPQRYKLTGSWLRRLLGEFKQVGGAGLEVLSGTASPGDIQSSAEYARRFDLLASCGSDFHSPVHGFPKLGRLPPMPAGLTPIWTAWEKRAPTPTP
jgi:predicted metal-dependent phosphoesterase TrpH